MTRLIDADKLYPDCMTKNGTLAISQSQIANAPTVFDCRSCKHNGNEHECIDCHDYSNFVKYEERPQGEWIDTGDMEEYWAEEYECSICGVKDHWHNYCPNCGADMRKGGAE